MPNRNNTAIVKLRSFEFLQFLEDEGLKVTCKKETLREIYYNQFRPICQLENRDTRGSSFGAVFFMWTRNKVLRRNPAKDQVNFNPNYKQRAQNSQRNIRSSKSPAPLSNESSVASSSLRITTDDPLPPWIKIQQSHVICRVCGAELKYKQDLPEHTDTRNHCIQGLILALKDNKPYLVANKDGIEISSRYDGPEGAVHFDLPEKQPSAFQFVIKNCTGQVILFKKCELLKKVGVFTLSDAQHVTAERMTKIEPGETYEVTILSCARNVGMYRSPIAFMFSSMDDPKRNVHIIRILSCRCKNQDVEDAQPTSPYTPMKQKYYTPRTDIYEGLAPDLERSSNLEREIPLRMYKVPNMLKDVIKKQFDASGLSGRSAEYFEEIRPALQMGLEWATYVSRFSTLLHAEEIQMELDIQNYNMKEVTMDKCKDNPRLLTLRVPGLAENRPSVLKGDVLYAAMKGDKEENREFKGYVHDVYQNEVALGFHKQLLGNYVKNMQFDVRFTFNRLSLQLMHRSMELADENSLEKMLFPTPETACDAEPILPVDFSLRLVNRQLESNVEQFQAIKHILIGSSRPAPYLIFGPPGTGKTVTLVEAIQQVLINIQDTHILACAPSNSAADLITQRLMKGRVGKSDIYRMCAVSRSYFTVPEDIKDVCNYDRSSQLFKFPSKAELQKYKVIVTTLVTAGRLASANFPSGHFTHVFIDEAGHATEPEAVIALAGIIETDVITANGGQVVLAGDPEQLGPILRSHIALKYGLGMSILERLMKKCKIYERRRDGENREVYDVKVVTKLLQNYRSHPSILELPNKLFYHSELLACADQMCRECLCRWEGLPKPGFPLVFHGIAGQDEREEKSPSFFNPEEVATVVDYVGRLMEHKNPKLKETDIGIISPYRKQVQKIQNALKKKNWKEIKVGSVEEFQGRENTVIIISTVRSDPKYLAVDADFKLGFLANPKRFNVAITRAKALLIIIGNPHTLARDKHWKSMLDFCKLNSAYKGIHYDGYNEELENIMTQLRKTKLDDCVSVDVAQGEDQPWKNDP